MERELIRERVNGGLDAARSKGRKGGRPKTLTDDKIRKIRELKKTDAFSVTQICDMVNVSRSSHYRAISSEEKIKKTGQNERT